MNRSLFVLAGLQLVICLGLVYGTTGCVGYVDGGGGAVVVPGPDLYFFGGPYYGRGEAHGYSHRGFSRACY